MHIPATNTCSIRIFFCPSSLLFAFRRKQRRGPAEQGTSWFCDAGIYCCTSTAVRKRFFSSSIAYYSALVFLNNRRNKSYASSHTLFLNSLNTTFFLHGFPFSTSPFPQTTTAGLASQLSQALCEFLTSKAIYLTALENFVLQQISHTSGSLKRQQVPPS